MTLKHVIAERQKGRENEEEEEEEEEEVNS